MVDLAGLVVPVKPVIPQHQLEMATVVMPAAVVVRVVRVGLTLVVQLLAVLAATVA